MRIRSAVAAVVLSGFTAWPSVANAQLWRNGSFDGFSGLPSHINASLANARTYDNFVVSGTGWTVTALFGEYLTDFVATEAYWEIRSGISVGLGGTKLHSGFDFITGITDIGSAFGLVHSRYEVSGFDSFVLAPGEYWFTMALVGTGSGSAFIATTAGFDGINAVSDGGAFFDSHTLNITYADASDALGAFSDFAYGVSGMQTSTVPEPATVLLVGTGLGALAIAARSRRKA